MANIPIIQSLWIGERLSVMERLCISSFLYYGHEFHLYVYDNVKDVPSKTILKDASKIIPADKIFKYKDHNSYAGFSNLFRYKMLLEKGGYWVDTDIICLKPFSSKPKNLFSSEKMRLWQGRVKTNCGVIKVNKGADIMQYCYEKANSIDPQTLTWGDTGPNLMAQAVRAFKLQNYVVSPITFCPVNFWQWKRLISESLIVNWLENKKINNSQAIHLWNEMWRRNGVNKDGVFPSSTIYEQLKRKYL